MAPVSSVLLAPGTVSVRFSPDPVFNNLASLYMVALADTLSGFDAWVERTASGLPAERTRTHRLLFDILYSAFEPDHDLPSFPAFLNHLAGQDPISMRDRFLKHMFPASGEGYAGRDQLPDLETFIREIDRSEFDREIGRGLFVEAHALLSDPLALRETIVAHLMTMWHEALAAEWEHNQAFVGRTVDALRSYHPARQYAGEQNAYQAIQAVTGRDVQGCWQRVLAPAETLIFIPSSHIGPYLLHYAYGPVVRILFSPRLPQGVEGGPMELTRSDFLVQLRALADDTRLCILELLSQEGELCAQEIITHLNLSKSSASRHLSQLSATGYLVEQQRRGKAKCYSLNPERFKETIRALEGYARS